MSDDTEGSAAMRGSVDLSEPLAWAVLSRWYAVPVISADEEAARRLAKGDDVVLPLYAKTHPTLTDADRLAIEWAAVCAAAQSQVAVHKTLRKLLGTTK